MYIYSRTYIYAASTKATLRLKLNIAIVRDARTRDRDTHTAGRACVNRVARGFSSYLSPFFSAFALCSAGYPLYTAFVHASAAHASYMAFFAPSLIYRAAREMRGYAIWLMGRFHGFSRASTAAFYTFSLQYLSIAVQLSRYFIARYSKTHIYKHASKKLKLQKLHRLVLKGFVARARIYINIKLESDERRACCKSQL